MSLTDDEVRTLTGQGYGGGHAGLWGRGKELFDQWLAQHDREIRQQALREATEHCARACPSPEHDAAREAWDALESEAVRK